MDITAEVIKDIILEVQPYEEFDETTDLIKAEILDSLTLMYIVTEIEDRFNLFIPEDNVTMNHFRSINSILQMVQSLGESNEVC